MSAKHTPGPWSTASDPCHFDSQTTVVAANGARVAEVTGSAFDEAEANARLIAAAPDLLEACKAFVAHYPMGTNPFLDDAFRAARAAIARATGEAG